MLNLQPGFPAACVFSFLSCSVTELDNDLSANLHGLKLRYVFPDLPTSQFSMSNKQGKYWYYRIYEGTSALHGVIVTHTSEL